MKRFAFAALVILALLASCVTLTIKCPEQPAPVCPAQSCINALPYYNSPALPYWWLDAGIQTWDGGTGWLYTGGSADPHIVIELK